MLKRIFASLLVLGSLGFQAGFALAQTSPAATDIDPQVAAQLQEKITALRSTVAALEAQVAQNQVTPVVVTTTLSPSDAAALQEALVAMRGLVSQLQTRITPQMSAEEKLAMSGSLTTMSQYLVSMRGSLQGPTAPATQNIASTPTPVVPAASAPTPSAPMAMENSPVQTPTVSPVKPTTPATEGAVVTSETGATAAQTETKPSVETAATSEGLSGGQPWGIAIILVVVIGLVYWFMREGSDSESESKGSKVTA